MHEHTPNTPQDATHRDELLTVADLALILKCKESSIYNLTRRRGRARYANPVPVLRLPCGLRHGSSKSELSDSTSHIFDGAIPATEDLYDVLDRRDMQNRRQPG